MMKAFIQTQEPKKIIGNVLDLPHWELLKSQMNVYLVTQGLIYDDLKILIEKISEEILQIKNDEGLIKIWIEVRKMLLTIDKDTYLVNQLCSSMQDMLFWFRTLPCCSIPTENNRAVFWHTFNKSAESICIKQRAIQQSIFTMINDIEYRYSREENSVGAFGAQNSDFWKPILCQIRECLQSQQKSKSETSIDMSKTPEIELCH